MSKSKGKKEMAKTQIDEINRNIYDIKIPFLAIWSVLKLFIFSPSNSTEPLVFVYCGLFNITFASVDFPAPFGPIIT